MAHAIKTDPRLTFEEYLQFEESSDVRHELVEGHLYAFAGGTDRHSLITVNITGMLWNHLRGKECRVYDSNMKVRVSERTAYYPDVMVACDPSDNHSLYRERPCLLVEVLSPSTHLTDRREKLVAYQTIESLQGYLMVYRDQHWVESYTRNNDGVWVHQDVPAGHDVWFPCVDLTVPVHALYEGVDMTPIESEPDEPNYR